MPGRSQSDDLRLGLQEKTWPLLKTMSCKLLPQREREKLQAAKCLTRNFATGMLNQNLHFFCVNRESYYKKAVKQSGGGGGVGFLCKCVYASFAVWSRVSFLVTAIPERLRGGNAASGCPFPSLILSLFLSRSLSLMLPLVSHFSSSPPSPSPSPSRLVSAAFLAQSVAVVRASHRGTGLNFPSTSLPLFLPLISPHLSCSSLPLLLSSPSFPSTIQPPATTTIHPTPRCICLSSS